MVGLGVPIPLFKKISPEKYPHKIFFASRHRIPPQQIGPILSRCLDASEMIFFGCVKIHPQDAHFSVPKNTKKSEKSFRFKIFFVWFFPTLMDDFSWGELGCLLKTRSCFLLTNNPFLRSKLSKHVMSQMASHHGTWMSLKGRPGKKKTTRRERRRIFPSHFRMWLPKKKTARHPIFFCLRFL